MRLFACLTGRRCKSSATAAGWTGGSSVDERAANVNLKKTDWVAYPFLRISLWHQVLSYQVVLVG